MLTTVLSAVLNFVFYSRSLEDEFHEEKLRVAAERYHVGARTLTARIRPATRAHYATLVANLKSARTDRCLEAIALASPCFAGIETVAQVLAGEHDAFRIRLYPKDLLFEVDIDHRFVGGSMFYRFVESLVGSSPRTLPRSRVLQGLWATLATLPQTSAIWRLPVREVPSGPNCHLTKQYTVQSEAGVARRFAAYYAMLCDAFVALGRSTLHVAFSVVFDGQPKVVNNVGGIVVTVERTDSAHAFARKFEAKTAHALATNALSVTGIGKIFGSPQGMRQRVDVVCTAMVVDTDALDAQLAVHPTALVYEQVCLARTRWSMVGIQKSRPQQTPA